MRLLVTGGAGFIGSHFVRQLLTGAYPDLAGARTVVVDKLTYAGNLANLDPVADHPSFEFLHADIRDEELMGQVMRGTDMVVHFAAESHVDRSIADASAFVETNVHGTQTLLQAAVDAKVGRFVHVSTDEVYGSIAEGAWHESQPLAPNSPYAASKAASDLLALAYHRTYGLPVIVTRCSNNYGPYQHPEKVVPLFATNLMDGLTVPLYNDGGNSRDWLHVDDHCHGIQLAATGGRPGEVYHIGGGTELTNRELTERLLALCGADDSSVRHVADRPGHDLRYALDVGKLAGELGYAPRTDFMTGLADTVRWYAENRSWWEPLKKAAQEAPEAD